MILVAVAGKDINMLIRIQFRHLSLKVHCLYGFLWEIVKDQNVLIQFHYKTRVPNISNP